MIIGFTGTREGMTHQQITAVIRLLMRVHSRTLLTDPATALHGDCIGADADFDSICRGLGIKTKCRPCNLKNFRANTGSEAVAEPEDPLVRNAKIVADSDMLIACPFEFEEMRRSGTWATIRQGMTAGISVHKVFPDGSIALWDPETRTETLSNEFKR